jgi:hypothetical protein
VNTAWFERLAFAIQDRLRSYRSVASKGRFQTHTECATLAYAGGTQAPRCDLVVFCEVASPRDVLAGDASAVRVYRPHGSLISHRSLRGALIGRNLPSFIVSQTMATAAFVAPYSIQEDFFTQDLMDGVHRLERQRAQAQDAYQRQASDEIAAMLLHYSMELEELRLVMRDRLLALTLGGGDDVDVDDAQVRGFFGGPTSQAQAQAGSVTGHTYELDGATIAALAALDLESDQERRAPNNDPRRSNPRETPVFLAVPHAIPPRVAAPAPGLPDTLLPE